MAEDHDLVRFLLGEMDDVEVERFYDLLENDPRKRAELKDLEVALAALGELRSHRKRRAGPWLLRAAAVLLAFFAGAAASHWLAAAKEPPRVPPPGGTHREFYDRYAEQPAERASLSRAMVALAGLRGQR